MTNPAEHAATVRNRRAGPYYLIAPTELKAIVDVAERATELETAIEAGLLVPLDASNVRLKAAEARAAELEREREVWKRESESYFERAERAEAALRWYDDHKRDDGSYDGEMWGDLRAALGETAPTHPSDEPSDGLDLRGGRLL